MNFASELGMSGDENRTDQVGKLRGGEGGKDGEKERERAWGEMTEIGGVWGQYVNLV